MIDFDYSLQMLQFKFKFRWTIITTKDSEPDK